jgi:hypothetical protein
MGDGEEPNGQALRQRAPRLDTHLVRRSEPARTRQPHSCEIRQAYDRVLAGASTRSRSVLIGAGGRVHLLEQGAGPPVVLLHGTGSSAGSFCRC